MKNKAVSVLIVDEQKTIISTLAHIIRVNRPEMAVNHCRSLGAALIASRGRDIQLIIIDFNINSYSSLDVVQTFKHQNPKADVLIYSYSDELHFALPCIKAGAIGYLSKFANEAEIIAALECVISGYRYASAAVGELLIDKVTRGEPRKVSLSSRELQVSEMLVQGYSIQEISKILNLHMSSVSTFKGRVFKKLDVQNLAELAEKIKDMEKSV